MATPAKRGRPRTATDAQRKAAGYNYRKTARFAIKLPTIRGLDGTDVGSTMTMAILGGYTKTKIMAEAAGHSLLVDELDNIYTIESKYLAK